MLNEFCLTTGYHRKYAIRILNGPAPGKRPDRPVRKRGLSYGHELQSVLTSVWEAAGYPWSVRLKALLVLAQRGGERGPNPPRANQGRIPPPPPMRDNPRSEPEPERHDAGRMNSTPHVNKDHWYGHDRPDDKRYHIDHPFEHGRFEHFGPSYGYRIERFDRDHHRLWLPGGFSFEVAAWDWPICADWCWDCADDFVIYEDTDHVGWYLLYNVHTGIYVHVQYLGT